MEDRGEFYERMASEAEWDEWTNPYETQRRLRQIFDILLGDVRLEGSSFLDAGAGGGHFSEAATKRGAVVTSLDVGTNLLNHVAQRCGSTGVAGSVLELPFGDGSFDVVMSTEVVEHTIDPLGALKEIARTVRPGGWLIVTTPGRIWQPVVRLASLLRLRPYKGHENFVWPRSARNTLERAGILVDRYYGFNLLPLFNPRFESFHRTADRLGTRLVWAYTNFAIRGHKK